MKKHCAIYTRKSTEEGLDMEFNSLDAQREACEAYITSQKAEGWVANPTFYDDGGFSGGNMERPALKQLLEDIKENKVHIVVVYKIDRLTRSLMDFSKLVEIFDKYGVTFVSVTQSFNTTTSMGRLTLNMLLSFAQFEREVGSERSRDKIAASKKKGMWMGGIVPMGYEALDRKLIINQEQAKQVNKIFSLYLKLGCVSKLKKKLDEQGFRSPIRISKKGNEAGGKLLGRGLLYKLLQNPVYIGKTRHKDKVYEGQHEGIISEELFEKVQQRLIKGSASIRGKKKNRESSLLQGLLFDEEGTLYTPTYTMKAGKQYRYYISQNLLQNRDHPKAILARLPAHEIEQAIIKCVKVKTLEKVILTPDKLIMHVKDQEPMIVPYKVERMGTGAIVIKPDIGGYDPFDLPQAELKKLLQGIVWRDEHFKGASLVAIANRAGHDESHIRRTIQYSLRAI